MAEDLGFRDEITSLLKRDPFLKFEISLVNGERFEINSPFQVAMNESLIIVAPSKQTHSFFRLQQIAAVKVFEPAN